MATIVQVLAAVGVVLALPQVYRFANFVWLYFLRPSTIHRYLHGPSPYALVTGATDGIGKALAQELYDKGFNLLLHGRNEDKMRKVVETLRARGTRDVRYFLADASTSHLDFERILAPYADLNITLVVHNVGGQDWTTQRIDGLATADLYGIVERTTMFPLLLTRALLPRLRLTAQRTHAPVLVQFVGSLAAEISPPRFSTYAGSKAFLKALVRGLNSDERHWAGPSGVVCEYLMVGQVQSNSMHCDASWSAPAAATFARAVVARAGCGRTFYAPYMPHAMIMWTMQLLGEKRADEYAARALGELITAEEKKA